MKAPAGESIITGEVTLSPAVHRRTCAMCGREGIRLPICALCQRDLRNVLPFPRRRA